MRKNQDIQNILIVLGSAIICAGALAALFIYSYGSTGRYLAQNVLLDSTILRDIDYPDKHPNTGKKIHFIFDQIKFAYLDPQTGNMTQKIISLQNYQEFYKLVASEKSLEQVTDPIKDLFLKTRPTVLTTTMRAEEGANHLSSKIFQVVQFVPENYFRVQLRENQENEEWAYFYQPDLYKNVMQLFTESSSSL